MITENDHHALSYVYNDGKVRKGEQREALSCAHFDHFSERADKGSVYAEKTRDTKHCFYWTLFFIFLFCVFF
ncbi:MAG: hypothetical protein CL920_23850 [Deltaproteobacteria bacterium]|nr:hypothetical protein [Deltaproteobacteria bacterium]